jgi:putative mycofactocin binding protein MftB
LSVTETRLGVAAFAADKAWRLNPQVALRNEAFGALAYHYGNRRLVFLKSRLLVTLVGSVGAYASASEAIEALVPPDQHTSYERALARLAASEVIDAR